MNNIPKVMKLIYYKHGGSNEQEVKVCGCVYPPFCPLSTCDNRCLPLLLF